MAQLSRQHVLDVENQIKCPANKLFDFIKNNFTMLPQIFPSVLKGEVLEGDGNSLGSVNRWEYVLGVRRAENGANPDEILVVKEKLVEIDEKNMSFTREGIEGDVMKNYKRFDLKAIVIPKGTDDESILKMSIIFEKFNENDPHPYPYLHFFERMATMFGSHLNKPVITQ
ncbi:hypothetical protein Sjap_024785 [Stephania japonica]|uniref:Bet v I/Major latex protein domain-containing protein n=1 Tax=Stephania japonica TaxID=461633 RepID=A0AAP0EJE0_9MAGN